MAKRFKEGTLVSAGTSWAIFSLTAVPITLLLKFVCFVLHKTLMCVVLWTAVFSAISCKISTELFTEQGTCAAVQKLPMQYTQRQEKSLFILS